MDNGGSLPNSNCEGLLESSGDFWRFTRKLEVVTGEKSCSGNVLRRRYLLETRDGLENQQPRFVS